MSVLICLFCASAVGSTSRAEATVAEGSNHPDIIDWQAQGDGPQSQVPQLWGDSCEGLSQKVPLAQHLEDVESSMQQQTKIEAPEAACIMQSDAVTCEARMLTAGDLIVLIAVWTQLRQMRRRKSAQADARRDCGGRSRQQLPELSWLEEADVTRRRSDRDRQRRAGDGNCYWRSVGNTRWRTLKRRACSFYQQHREELQLTPEEHDDLQRAFRKNRWNNSTVIRYLAFLMDVKMSIYERRTGSQCWALAAEVTAASQGAPEVALAFDCHHYDRLRGGPTGKILMKRLDERIRLLQCPPPPKLQQEATDKITPQACREERQEVKMAWQGKKKNNRAPQGRAISRKKSRYPSQAADGCAPAGAVAAVPAWTFSYRDHHGAPGQERVSMKSARGDGRARGRKDNQGRQAAVSWGNEEGGPYHHLKSAEREGKGSKRSTGGWRLKALILMAACQSAGLWEGKHGSSSNCPCLSPQPHPQGPRVLIDQCSISQAALVCGRDRKVEESLDGGAQSSADGRARTRRLTLYHQGEQTRVYVPAHWTHDKLKMLIPLHFAYRAEWVRLQWHDEYSVTVHEGPNCPRVTPKLRATLANLAGQITVTPSERRALGHKDTYLGHRSTRARGITVATHRFQEQLVALNGIFRGLLGGAKWNALGVLYHGSIMEHTDPLAHEHTYAVSVTPGTACFHYESPLNGRRMGVDLSHQIAVFSPQRPHDVVVDRRVYTLTLYLTKRPPTREVAQRLDELGFPPEERPFAPPRPTWALSPTPDPRRQCAGVVASQSSRDSLRPEEAGTGEDTSSSPPPSARRPGARVLTSEEDKPQSPNDSDSESVNSSSQSPAPSSSSGNGYAMATTPEMATDCTSPLSQESGQVAPTVRDSSEPEYAFMHPWYTDSEEERFDRSVYFSACRLDGGGEKETRSRPQKVMT